MEKFLLRILTFALISWGLGFLSMSIMKTNGKELIKNLGKEQVDIRLPKAYFWIGLIGVLFSSFLFALMVIFPNGTAFVWTYAICLMFILLGVYVVAEALVWRIQIFRHEDYFFYRTFLGKTYKIQYNEIEYYKDGTNTLVLKTARRRFFIDNKARNYEYLLVMLDQNKIKARKKNKVYPAR